MCSSARACALAGEPGVTEVTVDVATPRAAVTVRAIVAPVVFSAFWVALDWTLGGWLRLLAVVGRGARQLLALPGLEAEAGVDYVAWLLRGLQGLWQAVGLLLGRVHTGVWTAAEQLWQWAMAVPAGTFFVVRVGRGRGGVERDEHLSLAPMGGDQSPILAMTDAKDPSRLGYSLLPLAFCIVTGHDRRRRVGFGVPAVAGDAVRWIWDMSNSRKDPEVSSFDRMFAEAKVFARLLEGKIAAGTRLTSPCF